MADLTTHDDARGDGSVVVFPRNDAGVNPYQGAPSGEWAHQATEPKDINVFDILRALFDRKWMVLGIVAAALAVAVVVTMRTTKMYRATSTIEIARQEANVVDQAGVSGGEVADSEFIATQLILLESRSLAERVVEVLGLQDDADFVPQTNADGNQIPRERRVAIAAAKVQRSMSVEPVGRARVISLQMQSEDPEIAAAVANEFVESFILQTHERRFETTRFARNFLDERLTAAKTNLEEAERRLADFARERGILTAGGSVLSLGTDSIVALNSELTNATSERLAAEQRFRIASRNPSVIREGEASNLNQLRSTLTRLENEYSEQLASFGEEWPAMVQFRTRMESVREAIRREEGLALGGLEADYQTALAREQALRDRIDNLEGNVQNARGDTFQYEILARDVDTSRTTYDALLQRFKEVGVVEGLQPNQISIVDRATVPARPFKPSLQSNLAIAFTFGFGFAAALAYLLAFMDETIHNAEELSGTTGLPTLGVVPQTDIKTAGVLTELKDPVSPYSEAYFAARNNLLFSSTEGMPKTLFVTSSSMGEGKSSTAVSLAYVIARSGRSVLLVDADMRKPSISLSGDTSIGLSGLLTSSQAVQDHVLYDDVTGLQLLPAGRIPPNPAELLSGDRIRQVLAEARTLADVVIIDGPPIMGFVDAPRIAGLCAGTVFVVAAGSTRKRQITQALERLRYGQANVVGSILTMVDATKRGYGNYYYYTEYKQDTSNKKRTAEAKARRIELSSVRKIEDRDRRKGSEGLDD